jgi:uncharacterized protein
MVARLGIAGTLGAIVGAWILSSIDVTVARRFVSAYLLLMGFYILLKSTRIATALEKPAGWIAPLALGAGFLDASGGGGWGPMVTSTPAAGHPSRQTVGSVNATEFFVAAAASATFFVELGATPLEHLVPLVVGGVLAAPFGGSVVRHVPGRALKTAVGALIVTLSIVQLFRAFR